MRVSAWGRALGQARRVAVRLLGLQVRRVKSVARWLLARTVRARRYAWRVRSRLGVGTPEAVGLLGVAASAALIGGLTGSLTVALVHAAATAVVLVGLRQAVRVRQRSAVPRPVVAGVASIPERESALRQAVASLIGQVDRLYVYLNRYETVPAFLTSDKIVVFRSQDHGDLADNGKFFGLRYHRSGIFLSVDDDIIYPPDYVLRMTRALRKIGYQGIVGVHGVFYPTHARSFLNRKVVSYLRGNRSLRAVSLLGTGTVAFSMAHVGLSLDEFRTTGMADVWLARYAKQRRIPMLAVARPEQWLVDAEVPAHSPRLWLASNRDHRPHSSVIVGSGPWGLEDLVDRLQQAGLASRLPRKWQRFVAFHSLLKAEGPEAAVASAADAGLGDYVTFYCDPQDVLAVTEAALRTEGYESRMFKQTVAASASYHPAATAELLERALGQATRRRDTAASIWMACLAARAFRYSGDLAAAQRVLATVADRHGDDPEVRTELAALAFDSMDFARARDLLTSGVRPAARTSAQALLLASATARADSVAAAAPAVAAVFTDSGSERVQRRLISGLRGLGPVEGLADLPPLRALYQACVDGDRDPLPLVHLCLALGDRRTAATLLPAARAWFSADRRDYLAWLEAAVAPDFGTLVDRMNEALTHRGFSGLSVTHEPGWVTPLARLSGSGAGQAGPAPVSVIVTAFNCADTLPYALDSILGQTLGVAEILVVDDCSTDDTSKIISSYAARDARIVPLRTDTNSGPYVCRNLALARATGEYVAIHDSDDYAHPQRLEHQVKLLTGSEAVACYTGHVRISDSGALVPENNGEIVGEGPMTLMMRRQVIDELGYFLPVRSRGDIEHRSRMQHYYGAHRVVLDDAVLLFARDSLTTNSRTFELDPARFSQVRRLRAESAWRHVSARGRREALYVAPSTGGEDPPG